MKNIINSIHLDRHVVFLTILLDLISFGIAIPLLTNVFLIGDNHNTLLYGMLIIAFPLAQFFGSVFLGNLGEKISKKKILLGSIIFLLVGYLIFLLGLAFLNIPLMFLGRMVKGFSSGNIATIQSIIATIPDNKEKTAAFGTLGVYYGSGVILGPSFGNIFSNQDLVSWFNQLTPLLFAIILLIINYLLVLVFFKEWKVKVVDKTTSLNIFKSISNTLKSKQVGYVVIASLLNYIAFNIFVTFFQYYLSYRFGLSREVIGAFLVYISIVSALGQGLLLRFVANKMHIERIVGVFSFLLAISYFLFLLPIGGIYIYVVGTLVAIFQALTVPTVTALISFKSPGGTSLGVNQGLKSLGQSIPGFLALFITVRFVNIPMIIIVLVALAGWLIFTFNNKKADLE